MTDYIQVTTTTSTRDEAQALAEVLLEKRLAACVQISGPIESHYRWKGRRERSEEWLCTIKTARSLFTTLERAIRDHHPYEVPEIVACPIETGSIAYLDWMRSEMVH